MRFFGRGATSTEPTATASGYPADDPRAWIAYARSDLLLAETVPPSGVYLEHLCYHAPQAAEKAIKATIMHLTRKEAAFSHNVRRLARDAALAGAPPVPLSQEQAEALTQYASITRYPANLGEVDEAEWRRAVADARAVVEWADVQARAG